MNYNLGELENLFDRIKNLLLYYERTGYQNKEFRIYLSNGDFINMHVPLNTIPHLMGININYLPSTGLFKQKNAFELAKDLCDSAYTINKSVNDGILKYDNIFSPLILNKLERFVENIKVNVYQTEFVCKYDASRSYHITDKNQKYDYIIVRQHPDGKVGILCLKQKDNYYVPMSNQLFDSMDDCKNELKDLISYQPITLLNNMIINDEYGYDSKPFVLPYDAKLEKIDNMYKYVSEFKSIIDVSGEFKYSIKRLKQNRNNISEDNDLIEKIAISIKERKLIEPITSDSNLSNIISAFNDFLCNTDSSNTEVKESYSKLRSDLEELKVKILQFQKENDILTSENLSLKSANQELTEENNDYEEKERQIKKILEQKRA